jgi:hypothetical protein
MIVYCDSRLSRLREGLDDSENVKTMNWHQSAFHSAFVWRLFNLIVESGEQIFTLLVLMFICDDLAAWFGFKKAMRWEVLC